MHLKLLSRGGGMSTKKLLRHNGYNNSSSSSSRFITGKVEVFAAESSNNAQTFLPFENIPCIRRIPIVGTIVDFFTKSQKNLLYHIDQNHSELGPIYRDHIGPLNIVFVSDADMMRSVFLYEGKYPRHALPESWMLYNQLHGCDRGLFFMDGEEWLKYRKILNTLMLRGRLATSHAASINAANTVIEHFRKIINKNRTPSIPIEIDNLEAVLYKWATVELVNIMLGPVTANERNLQILEPLITEFSAIVHKIFEYSSRLSGISPNLARTLRLQRWSQFETTVTNTIGLAKELIEKTIKDFKGGDGLVADMQRSGISHDMIQKIMIDMIIAAGDTTAFTVQWTLHALATHPQCQRELRDAILMDTRHEYNTPLLRGTIKECLRLYPVAPLIGRFIAADAMLGNYRVPKDSLVVLSLYTSGRSSAHFHQPHDFIPSRWTKAASTSGSNDGQCAFKPQGSLPFAMGARSCVGRKVALNSMQVLIAQILKHFELKSNNVGAIKPILRMVTVPSQTIRIAIRSL